MKKITSLIILILCSAQVFAWGRLGHAAIAEIAQRHLTKEAKENIMHYTGGADLASFSVWMDIVAKEEPFKTELAGWHAAIATPDCESPVYIRKAYRNCRDGVTAMEYFRDLLKDYEEIEDSVVFDAIKCMVHIVADFHCPVHVRYTDCVNEGKYDVIYKGQAVRFHNFWDSTLLQDATGLNWKQYGEYVDRIDTWKKRKIRSVSKGWAREWFEDAAATVRPYIDEVHAGDTLPDDYVQTHTSLADELILRAGYQLAAALNEIFG